MKRGLHSRALVAQSDVLDQREDLKTLALVARDVRDREEGRPIQRIEQRSEHRSLVVIAHVGRALGQVEAASVLTAPEDGPVILGEGRVPQPGVSEPVPVRQALPKRDKG